MRPVPNPRDPRANAASKKAPRRQRIKTELREFAILAVYLFIPFTALAAFKAAVLEAHGISFAPWIFAAIKAIVSAKFLLIGRMFGLGDGLARNYPLILSTLYRSLVFLIVLFILSAVEEILIGQHRGESVVDSFMSIGGGTLWQVVAASVIMFLHPDSLVRLSRARRSDR
jgi:hypothetical protein